MVIVTLVNVIVFSKYNDSIVVITLVKVTVNNRLSSKIIIIITIIICSRPAMGVSNNSPSKCNSN